MKTIYLLVKEWEEFAQEVEEGYAHSLFEFDNDISIRDIIQKNIHESFTSIDLLNKIQNIDRSIKDNVIIYRDVNNWWSFCYPLKGSEKLAKNVKELLGEEWALKIKNTS